MGGYREPLYAGLVRIPDLGFRWMHGHSYFFINGVPHAMFACKDCGIVFRNWEDHYHCWDCMSKYCPECWVHHDHGVWR